VQLPIFAAFTPASKEVGLAGGCAAFYTWLRSGLGASGWNVNLDELRQRLHDPDQWVRVEALRILAMVEETRALRDIEWVFKNDPEPGVRQVAQWAGRIVYAAFKQSQRATASLPSPSVSDSEDALLGSLVDKDHRTYNQMQEQLLQHELVSAMQSEQPALPPPKVSSETTDAPGLLEAGLSDDFFRP
jgi:hypothetical protein